MSRRFRFRVVLLGTIFVHLVVFQHIPAAEKVSTFAMVREQVITRDTTLPKDALLRTRLVIQAGNITIDGNGATLLGPGAIGDAKSLEKAGVGVFCQGCNNVTLRNLKVKGFALGLDLRDARDWTIEGCDFSDNYHNPAHGWGELPFRGGLLLTHVQRCTLRKNRANRVWDGLHLRDSDDNLVAACDFSHCSNTCARLWTACRNRFVDNNLSYGLRISPGEVHARDSTCVLLESGSNNNRFTGNDCTHGGDGIFVRVLNGWVSTGNVFENNDCSYANNNCVEAWSPRNVYRGNKANHGSYGFWLGASDQTVLENNEASFNGDPKGFHNSPHLPQGGHAGIVFMFGPSSHTIVRGNICAGNNGAGIALVGDLGSAGRKWKAFHWIIEKNTLQDNRWGIYVKYADWVDLVGNTFQANRQGNVRNDGGITNFTEHAVDPKASAPPRAVLQGPAVVQAGRPVVFDASDSRDPQGQDLRFRWDLGDGTIAQTARVEHVFRSPGFHRLGLTVSNGSLSDLAWRDLYVVDDVEELGTEGQAKDWSWVDPHSRVRFSDDRENRICGKSSVLALVRPYSGNRVQLLYPASRKAGWPVQGKKELVFWVKAINENVPAWQFTNPVVALHQSETKAVVLTPTQDLMSQRPNNEEREGWSRFVVPLAGNELWKREGADLSVINYLTLGFDSWGAPPLWIWIDGLSFR